MTAEKGTYMTIHIDHGLRLLQDAARNPCALLHTVSVPQGNTRLARKGYCLIRTFHHPLGGPMALWQKELPLPEDFSSYYA